MNEKSKIHLYQIFTRLYGNKNTNNRPWGTRDENGVGKFSDITDTALKSIRDLGMTHVWFTGIPHHALVGDYSQFGISNDHPAVVKGRAGSPYAVKDYYSVNPDLADCPANRNQEFRFLIERTHKAGLKVVIDIVPNHVARHYQGLNNPDGVSDFGAQDDVSVEYARDNNFYYIPNQAFQLPELPQYLQPLGGELHPMLKQPFIEFPAKWTGNGSRLCKPNADDWYETVKINYGIRPDGSKDFPELPCEYRNKSYQQHFSFWQNQSLPDSWLKFRDIALYWLSQGVDGFRFDMAEMVPVEFWSFLNSSIKMSNKDAFLVAEVYQPHLYRDYIQIGKMDALYDKVDLYDSLKDLIRGQGDTRNISRIQNELKDIESHMLHFLDNHDEQRIPCSEFAGNAEYAKPAMVLSATISNAPTMLYFGQEVGEAGAEQAGFGQPSRTSIFDYIGVPSHQRWMNNGAFDGGQSSPNERALRDFYQKLMQCALHTPALFGETVSLNLEEDQNHGHLRSKLYGFARYTSDSHVLVLLNFDNENASCQPVCLSGAIVSLLGLRDGQYRYVDALEDSIHLDVNVIDGQGIITNPIKPLASHILHLADPG
ncbi:alpha-amylase family protein [Vibrio sp. ZSDZ34]|uniref:Alpha-amylase family protein n=1 Tax=Vibrio gelatinilyticus TaxID=2893468 RepID=A0A9X1W8H2_9VIBR|nr:alpha-amylase family protein [Vibrio gelatinilyticus]MCJ2376207.1 alpha-amylase family protein [Vibrio gelatinilyticus]